MQSIETKEFGETVQCDGSVPRDTIAYMEVVERVATTDSVWKVTEDDYNDRDGLTTSEAVKDLIKDLEEKEKVGIIGYGGVTQEDNGITLLEMETLSNMKRSEEKRVKKVQKETDDMADAVMKIMLRGSRGSLRTAIEMIMQDKSTTAAKNKRGKLMRMIKKVRETYCGSGDRLHITDDITQAFDSHPVAKNKKDLKILLSNYTKLLKQWNDIYLEGKDSGAQAPPSYGKMKKLLLQRLPYELQEYRQIADKNHEPPTWVTIVDAISAKMVDAVDVLVHGNGSTPSSTTTASTAAGAPVAGALQMAAIGSHPDNRCRQFLRHGTCTYGKECRYKDATPGHPSNEFKHNRQGAPRCAPRQSRQ
jgi:hypothetical protein